MPPKQKVLVVGDSKTEREAVALAFQRRGFRTGTASPFELRFAAAREQPDLVLLDLGSRSEAELGELLGGDPVECRFVLTADRPWPELRDLAARWKAAGYATKSKDADETVSRAEPFLPGIGPGIGPGAGAAVVRPPRERVDFVALARQSTRSQFVAACPFPLLVSSSNLVSRPAPRTAGILDREVLQAMEASAVKPSGRPHVTVLAVRKLGDERADRVTAGRGLESDIIIDHATISKLHATFVKQARGYELADAGSRNGTWLSGRLLERNGPPSALVESGDTVRFGEIECTFLSPSAAWDQLRVNVK